MSAVVRKSITDLTRRKTRAVFTVLTLAIAVASVGIFAIPGLMDRAMQKEVAANRLPDLTLSTKPLVMTPTQLAAIDRLPNVAAVAGRSYFQTRVWVGARRVKAIVIGVPDYARQDVDVVAVKSGRAPTAGSVLTDVENAEQGRFSGGAGDVVRVVGVGDRTLRVPVSGVARNLTGGQAAANFDAVILYSTPGLIRRLGADPGFSSLELRLHDVSRAAADRTTSDVARYLAANTSFRAFSDLPERREPGTYPGKDLFEQLTSVMNVFTILALLAGLVLIANTMTTLVGEQRREIAIMKAIGATSREIRRVYLRTAFLLGAAGSVLGVALGCLVANAVVAFFGSSFFAISPPLAISMPVVVASLVIGLLAPPLAALPAIRRGTRVPVGDALQDVGALHGGQAALDRALRRLRFLPRTAQIGIRSVTRRGRRSFATVVQIALAVATLLAVLALVDSVTTTTNRVWNDSSFDITLNTVVGRQFDARAQRLVRGTPGVAQVQPMLSNVAKYQGKDGFVWGYDEKPMFRVPMTSGRWYTPEESASHAQVAVIANNLARVTGTKVGETATLQTAAGQARFRVVGVTTSQWFNGMGFFVPLATMQGLLGTDTVNGYFVRTTSRDHAAIDRTTTRLEDRLNAAGYGVGTQVKYSAQQSNVSQNRAITTAIAVLGLLIVAISMVGLVNAVTMSVIERIREIGVLRSIGARARDIRRIFASEGIAVSLLGWLVGIPVGYGLAWGFHWLIRETVNIDFGFTFPPLNVAIVLVATVVLALLLVQLPVRRAVRYKSGEAIRHV